jgi:hypothetical protein
MPNPLAGGPPLVGCPRQLIQYIPRYPPYLEAVSCTSNLRTRHAVVARDPPIMALLLVWLPEVSGGYFPNSPRVCMRIHVYTYIGLLTQIRSSNAIGRSETPSNTSTTDDRSFLEVIIEMQHGMTTRVYILWITVGRTVSKRIKFRDPVMYGIVLRHIRDEPL